MLVLSPHPDDAEVSAGGTLAKMAAAGAEITTLIATDGDRGSLLDAINSAPYPLHHPEHLAEGLEPHRVAKKYFFAERFRYPSRRPPRIGQD